MENNISNSQSPKKVLIICYYWPPAGGPGVQRWLKFTKYLPCFGIQPIVYIPENPSYPIIDNQLFNEVSNQIIILKNKITEPYQLVSFFSKKTKKISAGIIPKKEKQSVFERIALWIRGNVFIPDARFLWIKPSVKYLFKYIQENNIDTIITTGPPHSLHLIGLNLKQKLNIKWIADFRDPWTTIGYHKSLKLSAFAEKKHKKLESLVLNTSDEIIVTSKTTKSEFEKLTAQPITVITNGYDFERIEKPILDEKFSLAHIGSFLSDRNPQILWQVLSEILNEIPTFKNDFQLKLIGTVSQEVISSIEEYKLSNYIKNMGYIPHKDAVVEQRKSQVLLLIEIDSEDTRSIIPGKIFEYMVSERPIIGIGPKGSDFEEIIENTNTGIFVNYHEKLKLKNSISNYYSQFLENNLKTNPVNLDQYSRKKLTEKLSKIIF